MNFGQLLSAEGWLFLQSITDAGNGHLQAVICVGGHKPKPREIVGRRADEILATPLEYSDAPYYELTWGRYLTFMVRDEGVAAYREKEEYVGHGLREYRKSWLLGVLPELFNGTHEIDGAGGPVRHFGVYSLNHIVDVLAYEEPVVRDLGRRFPAKARSAVID